LTEVFGATHHLGSAGWLMRPAHASKLASFVRK
jgi:hypothetical protein